MYKNIEKLKEFLDDYLEVYYKRLILLSCIIAIACIVVTVNGNWGKWFNYSKEEYQLLEEEGRNIIENVDYQRE